MKKKNLPLLVGLSLPLLLVIIVLFNNWLSRHNYHPQYDFIFSVQNPYSKKSQDYFISDHHLALRTSYKPLSDLYIYKVNEDKTYPLTWNDVKQYNLDPSLTSPDGYSVKKSYGSESPASFFMFLGDSTGGGVFLEGKNTSKRINIGKIYYWNVEFLGWIIHDGQ